MNNSNKFNILQLLLATLIVSTSGVLGKYIAMPTEIVIWFRSFIGMFALLLFCKLKKIDIQIKEKKDYKSFGVAGIFMALHWVTFFYALRLSNVAIGILSFYTFPIMLAVLEPIFLKTQFQRIHVVLGAIVLLGLYMLVPEFNIEDTNVKGILCGIISALFYTIRILILKKAVTRYNGSVLMLYQTFVISIVLSPYLFIYGIDGWQEQWHYLLLLGILTTAIGHGLIVHTLKYFSATTSSIISSVQPIFGITLAIIFLNEIPTKNIYLGGTLILITAIIESLRSTKIK